MKIGTKSILFGVHQFLWHPITVLIAWVYLYRKFPNWKECICIIIHDWGYWGVDNIDGEEGEKHPEWAANIVKILFGIYYYKLCLYHSRHYAKNEKEEPSILCWADKFSIVFDPYFFYIIRATISGEIVELRKTTADAGFIKMSATNKEWFAWVYTLMSTVAKEQRGDAAPYVNPERNNHE